MNGQISLRNGFRRLICVGFAWVLTMSVAQAAGGRITFAGAITAPTCTLATQGLGQALSAHDASVVQGHCPAQANQRPDEARAYDLRVTQLSNAMVDARVETYFQDFGAAPHTLLATQTYR